ncbi:recombinase family protein [Sphingomonas arenae]|uniref:recombinase family protein n=1 Tax=Sphingomonas arenae TaxID=2812555 RepID=UPI00196723AE|nr:recombinase family protein [Sphingomonas arenae]
MLQERIETASKLPAPKVYSYARWSTPEQAKGDSNRRQAEAAEKWAARHGYQVDLSLRIVDEGVSAYRGGNALDGGLSRFLEACRRGLIEEGSFLLVESLDRISRMAPRKAQRLIDDIVDNGVTIVTLSDDQHYTAERLDNDPTALLIALMVSWRAHEESKTKGRRVADAWAEKRRKVRANPKQRLTKRGPSWLVPTQDGWWREDEVKAGTVRRIFSLTLNGMGEHAIAKLFNEDGVPVLGKGKQWHRSTVCKVLRNPAVIGRLIPGHIEYAGEQRSHVKDPEPVEGAFPSVVSQADWLAVRTLKDGRTTAARGRHSGRPVAHFFAGLARCPLCNGAMVRVNKGSAKKGGLPKLVCSAAKTRAGCRYVSVDVRLTEEALLSGWGWLFANVPADDPSGALNAQHDDLDAAIAGTEDHLADLTGALERAPSVAAARSVAKVEAELRTMRTALVELEERKAMADRCLIVTRLAELHDLLEDQERREDRTTVNAALKLSFAGVVVDYTTGRLRFQWRQGGEAELVYAWVE